MCMSLHFVMSSMKMLGSRDMKRDGNGDGKWEMGKGICAKSYRGRDDSGLSVILTNRARDD